MHEVNYSNLPEVNYGKLPKIKYCKFSKGNSNEPTNGNYM